MTRTTQPHDRRPLARSMMVLAAWVVLTSVRSAHGDTLVLQPAALPFRPTQANQLFIHLINDSTRQGLQLDLSYDPRILQVLSVSPLGRLQSPLQLYNSPLPSFQGHWRGWPTSATLHLLAYDGAPSRASIGTGTDEIIVVNFAVRDTVPEGTAYVWFGDALAASEALAPVPIAPETTQIQLDGVTGTLVTLFTAAIVEGGRVLITWELSSPTLGVNVCRSFLGESERTKLNDAPISGSGPHTVLDTPPGQTGTLVYEILSVGTSGETSLDRRELDWEGVPSRFALYQNAPNPFSSSTLIRFDVARRTRVRICVYDVAGREVRVLQDHILAPGRYSAMWDGLTTRGTPVSSGVYSYVLVLGQQRLVRRAVHFR